MKLILIFSHTLTEEQITDAKNSLDVDAFVYMPDNLVQLWANVPTHKINMHQYLEPIQNFIFTQATKNDFVLIQGDFGATYNTVTFCKNNQLKTIYSTTKRISKEIYGNNGVEKISVFSHVLFREY